MKSGLTPQGFCLLFVLLAAVVLAVGWLAPEIMEWLRWVRW